MENKYELFLSNAVVINVRSENEFKQFIQLMRNLGLSKSDYMKKIYDKYGFEKGFCYNAGLKYCNPEDVCFEYQLGKGFTFSSISEYTRNDYFEICSLEDIMLDTGYSIKIDNVLINNPLLVEIEEGCNQYNQFVMMIRPEDLKKSIENYQPINGFYDLREYDIPEDKFIELWKMQEYLKSFDKDKITIKSIAPEFWNHLKELSGYYQKQLLSYPIKQHKEPNESYREIAKKYSIFIEHYESYLKKKENHKQEQILENDPMAMTVYKVIKENMENRFYPWRFLCGENIEQSLCEIFKKDIGKTYQLLGALDVVTDDFFPLATDELENYYKRENIDFDEDRVINELDSFKTKADLDPTIFSKETIAMFDIYNEANKIETELFNYYKDMQKELDKDLEIEK